MLLDKIKSKPSEPIPRRPVWKGPEVDGITQGLLSRFLACRERFRILVVEGLKPADKFNHRLEYGQMWHACEEALAAGAPTRSPGWPQALMNYCQDLCRRYPTQQQQIDHWYNVCRVQFPLYVEWWAQHPDVTDRAPLLQEQVFDVPYSLPSGRTVRLRGKWDSVDLIGNGKDAGVYLQENKSKGDIDELQLRRQLGSGFDLQTMTYLAALNDTLKLHRSGGDVGLPEEALTWPNVLGVRYNVVRRPLSGGKGSIRQHQPTKSNPRGESSAAFYTRLGGIIKEDPGYYFMRWRIEISPADVARFRRECLDPILEQLCYWWDMVTYVGDRPRKHEAELFHRYGVPPLHFRYPFGVYNPLNEGNSSDLDNYLASGSEIGLQRVDNLFPELT